jgi:Uncharacterized protein conserved in bacteria
MTFNLRKLMFWTFLSILILTLVGCRTKVKEEYYSTGVLKSSVEYRGKKKNGEAREYYPNGELRAVVRYKRGKEEGLAEYYSQDGVITMDVEMKGGKKNGRMRTYFHTGEREMECYYENDKLEGTQSYYDKLNKKVSEMHYKNDAAEGAYTAWYSKTETINGLNALRCTGFYKNGMMDGEWNYYDENEMPVGHAVFQQGTGKMTTYHNGEVVKVTNYVKNKKEGDETEYDGQGNVVKTITYHNDRIVAIDGVAIDHSEETANP